MTSASTVHSLGNRVPFSQPRNFAFRDNPRLPRLRRDLHIRKHTYRGRVSYVIKDPVSLRYYRLGPLEYFIASHLDGLTTENDLLLLIDESFGKGTLTRAELRNILNSFLMMSLLELDSDRALSLANNLNQRQRDLLRKTSLLRHLGKITSFKISLLDPDIILLRLSKATSFLWTKSAIIILFVLLLTAILTLILNWDEAIAKTPDFFSLQNLIYLWIVSIFVKICHEFGHGLSCKHYGGEVHDMGFMCIVFTPYLFCDATDSWTFPNKWHRFFVTLAGIYVELFLASFAAILWVITEPGLLNQLSFNVMIVCSVSTILMNLNPLMKYDGYYALSDFLEIPNLRERADRFFFSRVAEFLTGYRLATPDPIAQSLRYRLSFYSIACYLWLISVTFGILLIIDYYFREYGLHRLLQIGAFITLFYSLVLPFVGIYKAVKQALRLGASKAFLFKRLVLIAFVLAAIFLIPFPYHFRTSCIISKDTVVPVSPGADGFLRSISEKEGNYVQSGQLLARLENPKLTASLNDVRGSLRAHQILESYSLANNLEETLASARFLIAQLRAQEHELSSRIHSLELFAPVSGTILSAPSEEKLGELIQSGSVVFEILPEGPTRIFVPLSETAAAIIRPGDRASLCLLADPAKTYTGRVISVSPIAERILPHDALGNGAGGTVPLQASQALRPDGSYAHLTASPFYEAIVLLDQSDPTLRPGMSGRIKISAGWHNLAWRIHRWFVNKLRKDYQL